MSYSKEPRLVGYNLGHLTYEYLMRMVDLGVLAGPLGEMKLNPELGALMNAIHHVAAGGSVKVEIQRPGHPDIVRELDERLEAGTEEANTLNRKAGYYLTITT